jgi:hypothetical protein
MFEVWTDESVLPFVMSSFIKEHKLKIWLGGSVHSRI